MGCCLRVQRATADAVRPRAIGSHCFGPGGWRSGKMAKWQIDFPAALASHRPVKIIQNQRVPFLRIQHLLFFGVQVPLVPAHFALGTLRPISPPLGPAGQMGWDGPVHISTLSWGSRRPRAMALKESRGQFQPMEQEAYNDKGSGAKGPRCRERKGTP